MDAVKLTKKERMEALLSRMFIAEKRDGRFRGQNCAIGSKKQNFDGYEIRMAAHQLSPLIDSL